MNTNWPNIYKRSSRNDWVIDCGTMGGNRRILYVRKTLAEAETKAQECRLLREKIGQAAKSLTTAQLLDATSALALLQGRCSLTEAAQAYVEGQDKATCHQTVLEAFTALLADQATRVKRHELREHSYASTNGILKPFVAKFGGYKLDAVTRQDIQAFADTISNTYSRGNAIRYIRQLFNFARHREWIATSPAEMVKAPAWKYASPKYLTADQVEHLFNIAGEHDPALLPRMALGFFAGLRPIEVYRLNQADIKGTAGIISISVDTSKTEHPRVVPLTPQLLAFLIHPIGECPADAFQGRFRALFKVAGIKGGRDIARHSFASHHLAYTGDPSKTAHALGHVGAGWSTLFNHYAAIGLTKDEANQYFAIGLTKNKG